MFKALHSLNGSVLKERPLRVKRAVEKSKLEKKIGRVVQKNMNKKGFTAPKDPKKLAHVSERFKKRGAPQYEAGDSKETARKFHFKRKIIQKK